MWCQSSGGCTWVGHLTFVNLDNVNFMKEPDAASKGKVVPNLMPKALWWFRWGAVFTVLFGFLYYMMLLGTEKISAKIVGFLIAWTVAWLVVAALLRMSVAGGPLKDGRVLAVVLAALILVVALGAATYLPEGGNRTIAIAIRGRIGFVTVMKVWIVISP